MSRIYQSADTIAAIATPPGEGGVAIIRISGRDAFSITAMVFSGPVHTYKSHTAHYGQILDSKRVPVDTGLLLVMREGRSYTGEDTAEIHCHGGALISQRVLEVVLQAGARSAEPGEFTFRAFMNGKLDLAQAEAVQALICAKNEHALDAAENQLQGALSKKISAFQKDLTSIAAILEAWVDFPEEGLEFASIEEICEQLNTVSKQVESLIHTFHDGRIAHNGVSLCLAGCPNVGKSSLMNALLDKDRAIVSSIPGTTRDVLEDHLRIRGLHFRLMDTAGIRQSDEIIEQEGIRRSKEAIRQADLVLLVLDAVKGLSEEEIWLLDQVPKAKTIVVWNKVDLQQGALPQVPCAHVVSVSAKERLGLEDLLQKIDKVVWDHGPPSRDEILITSLRHKESLQQALEYIKNVIYGLQAGVSPELLTIDMRQSLIAFGQIIGTDITEEILTAIFSKFCIGK